MQPVVEVGGAGADVGVVPAQEREEVDGGDAHVAGDGEAGLCVCHFCVGLGRWDVGYVC